MDDSLDTVAAASRGDPAAIEQLLERHLSAVRAFVRLRMGPELRAKESASDLVQSTCREVLQHLDRFQYQGDEQFRRWFFTTALRKVKNRVQHYHSARRDVRREAGGDPQTGDWDGLARQYATLATPSQDLALREQVTRLESAFDGLPDHYREVVTLHKVCGLPHREIAALVGRTEAATRMILCRALAAIAIALGVDEG